MMAADGGVSSMKLYENIRELRLQNGWSQEELAKRAGYTDRSTIAKIESGDVDLRYSKILVFSKVFGVDPVVLMGLDDEIRAEVKSQISELSPEELRSALDYIRFVHSSGQ